MEVSTGSEPELNEETGMAAASDATGKWVEERVGADMVVGRLRVWMDNVPVIVEGERVGNMGGRLGVDVPTDVEERVDKDMVGRLGVWIDTVCLATILPVVEGEVPV